MQDLIIHHILFFFFFFGFLNSTQIYSHIPTFKLDALCSQYKGVGNSFYRHCQIKTKKNLLEGGTREREREREARGHLCSRIDGSGIKQQS